MVLEEQKQLAAKSFFKLFERPGHGRKISSIHEHRSCAVLKFRQNTGLAAGARGFRFELEAVFLGERGA